MAERCVLRALVQPAYKPRVFERADVTVRQCDREPFDELRGPLDEARIRQLLHALFRSSMLIDVDGTRPRAVSARCRASRRG